MYIYNIFIFSTCDSTQVSRCNEYSDTQNVNMVHTYNLNIQYIFRIWYSTYIYIYIFNIFTFYIQHHTLLDNTKTNNHNQNKSALNFPHSPDRWSHELYWNPMEFGIYIDASDFRLNVDLDKDEKNYFGLALGREVGLKYAGVNIKCVNVVMKSSGSGLWSSFFLNISVLSMSVVIWISIFRIES